MNKKKVLCLVLALAVVLSFAAGCGKKKTANLGFESDMPTGVVEYPLDTDETLTYWMDLPAAIATDVANYGETNFAKTLKEKTGINIEYIHPAAGTQAEALQLMMASGEMADMIQTSWLGLGPQTYIDQKQIYPLNDIIDAYAPNLKAYIEEDGEIDKMIKTDKGQYYAFPFVRGHETLLISTGFILRSDWLKEDGLALPETIEDWDAVLEAFQKRCTTPLALANFNHFAGGFDTYYGEYIKNGKVVYGPTEKNFKNFLAKLNEWYKKGYIDKNYAMLDTTMMRASFLNDKAGVVFDAGGGGMGAFITQKKGQAFDVAGSPFPTHKKGETPKFSSAELKYGLGGVAITTSCKNPALAARFLDYGYSEEGHMTYNFGKEGQSYNMIDGYPTYVEEITANKEGKNMSQMLAHNCLAGVWGPFVQDKIYLEQFYATPQQQEAVKNWSNNDTAKTRVPQIIMTRDESNEYTAIKGEIDTFVSEAYHEFITGKRSLDTFDDFVKEVKAMGIEDALAIKQGAYERFLKR